ncbi:MAG: prolipoprotein diacylglyceryl transferase [Acidobacteria bacterium]|nr:prolipoprotein diacylglyceryl transferase [Acidobacteriota bacterium]
MTFPVYIHLFGLTIHPHLFFELIAYSVGFHLYRHLRKGNQTAFVPLEQIMVILVGCIFGALFGAKILNWLEALPYYLEHTRTNPMVWLEGKTIVGGFIGGWMGVELAKKLVGVTYSTGDVYVFPMIVGTCIGRVGCFLTGKDDVTYGVPTTLPWGVDFGFEDHLPRHPTQIYEILFLILFGMFLRWHTQKPHFNGYLFRLFMFGYFAFRFGIEFIKPRPYPYFGLSAIQWAALGAAVFCWFTLKFGLQQTTPPANQAEI